jgi:hypothetical protein
MLRLSCGRMVLRMTGRDDYPHSVRNVCTVVENNAAKFNTLQAQREAVGLKFHECLVLER